ncbi:MAG: mercaptopyruvate sulfurtransferase [Piptocephalis tieghemiana]|nr:MAG: mercaptopyruvate sulfurtransferase [Piptocephalis tieghemiana]
MSNHQTERLIQPEDLQVLLESSSKHTLPKVLDASWHMPATGRRPKEEFLQGHIPGAQFFDIDLLSDPSSPYPHMLPSPETFSVSMGQMGISRDDHVIVYDQSDVASAARAFWMFKVFGHAQVSLLDGGWKGWKEMGGKLASGPPSIPTPKNYHACPQSRLLVTYDQVVANTSLPSPKRAILLDSRSPGRFSGREPEPRPNLPSGHIPYGINLPFRQLLDPKTGKYKSPEELQKILSPAAPLTQPIITSCGSGVTACVLWFGLLHAGAHQVAVYDGSWSEYAAKEGSAIARNEDKVEAVEGQV